MEHPHGAAEDRRERELAELEAAYARGDFAAVRDASAALSSDASVSGSVRERARSLGARVAPDRGSALIWLGALLAFIGIVVTYAR